MILTVIHDLHAGQPAIIDPQQQIERLLRDAQQVFRPSAVRPAYLPESVAKIARLLRPGGRFILDEHACDRLDEQTARWYFLHRVGDADAPASLKACRAEWDADHDDLHGYAAMREQLDRHFNERFFVWMPYLYAELANVDEEQERALIEAGAIQAMGFRYVGEPKAPNS